MKPTLAITLGDPAGIGSEIIAKTLADPETYNICNPLVVGDKDALQMGIEVAKTDLKIHVITEPTQAKYNSGTIDLIDLSLTIIITNTGVKFTIELEKAVNSIQSRSPASRPSNSYLGPGRSV